MIKGRLQLNLKNQCNKINTNEYTLLHEEKESLKSKPDVFEIP